MNQRFCARRCQTEHEAVHGRPAAQVEAVTFACKHCGGPFSYKPAYLTEYRKKFGKGPMYCSVPCSAEGRKADADARHTFVCLECKGTFPAGRRESGLIRVGQSLCSTECRSLYRRKHYQVRHADAVPTRRVVRNGYIRIIVPGRDGAPSIDTFEHRFVMEQHLGRKLTADETVHHVDGDRANNALDNLELFSSRHGPGQRVLDKVAFAIDMLRTYPEFAARAGVKLVEGEREGQD